MRCGIQFIRLQKQQMYKLRNIGLNHERNTIPNSFIFNHLLILIIPLLIFAFCTGKISAEQQQNRWSGVIEISEEFSSDDAPKAIPDAGTTTSSLSISEAGTIVDLDVQLNINHESDGNLDIYLIAPDGTRVELFTDVGGVSSDFIDTIIDNEAGMAITDGAAPFTDSYRPEGNLADFYNKSIEGTWTLEVTDDWGGNTGTLNSWSLIAMLQVKGPVPSPIIQAEASTPGGTNDTISWSDVGEIYQGESNIVETIPDEGTLTSTIVLDADGVIDDVNVKLNISHDWVSELDVYLIAPDGTSVELFTDVGGSKDDFIDTVLDDDASQSITEGSAPFTGSFRPEGSLEDLIGKPIQGQWKLEITDDSWFGSGTLNSWSITIDKNDVIFYSECAIDPDFTNVIANTDWMADRSCTFAELDSNQEYWYRTKARPLIKWMQTGQEDFENDILTGTQITNNGDVVLAGGGSDGSEINVIENPSFETGFGWEPGGNSMVMLLGVGIYPGEGLWMSDGDFIGGIIINGDFWILYDEGDYAFLQQTVDWTDVETLVFDYYSALGDDLTVTVLIGDDTVWTKTIFFGFEDEQIDVTIDVSEFSGEQDLTLMVECNSFGQDFAGVFWDNFRTYGASGSVSSGSIVSAPIILSEGDTLEILEFNTTIPEGTGLTVDILPEDGSTPIAGYEDVPTGTDLRGLDERTVRLRANLSTSDPEITPVLHDWSVTYTDASCESDWSNIVSSLP